MTPLVDLTDLDLWAREVPYAEFARLRRDAPVAWFPEAAPNSGFWSVTRYADILAASRDVATFSSSRGVSFEEPTDADMAARRTIIDTDPPGHTKLRKIMSGSFTQRAVAVYEYFVAGLTEQVLDNGLASGEIDFVDAVAKEVPIRGRLGQRGRRGHARLGPAGPGPPGRCRRHQRRRRQPQVISARRSAPGDRPPGDRPPGDRPPGDRPQAV
jgi:hypothetical protein